MRKNLVLMNLIICVLMMATLSGCSRDNSKSTAFLEDVQYIRVSRSQPDNLIVIKSDIIIDKTDERFEKILNSLKNTEFTEYTGEVLYPIGEGPTLISFYGKDNHLSGYMKYVHYDERIIEDARKMGLTEIWHLSIEAEPYHGNFEFGSEENEKVFWENIHSIMMEGDSLVEQ